MKKLILCLCAMMLLFVAPVKLYAEEVVEPEPEQAITEEEFGEKVKGYLEQYVGDSLAIKIVEWLVDAGVLAGMFGVWLKYRKYKHNTVEEVVGAVKTEVGTYTANAINSLSEKEIKSIIDSIKDLETATETIMKVLVLMQDTTPEGKVALLDYLGSKTKNEDIKEQAEVEKEKIAEKIEKDDAVREKVSGEYEEIF